MKKFLFKTAAFALLQIFIFAAFWNPDFSTERNYLAASIDKHRRLKTTPSPRVILVGGSNLPFSIESQALERELSRPLINMGLVAGLGIRFMLDEVESQIRSGDIVILSFEHNIFAGFGAEPIQRQMLEFRPQSLGAVPAERLITIADTAGFSILGALARRSMLPPPKNETATNSEFAGYRRDLFDEQGSYRGHFGKASINPALVKTEIYPFSEPNRLHLERFARSCHERGAACFYSFPPNPAFLITPPPPALQTNLATLKRIPYLTVLDEPADQTYPNDAFYDSPYHLLEAGARERTRRLIEKLKPPPTMIAGWSKQTLPAQFLE